ncbi:trehalose-phosphatase [Neomoorella mulderi]|uniref:Trehalose 6-phosphate phosphatase n=1 Tax=Moorella mulderi DSM 14980 TaxID=1122241 RepID=A0A151B027_9FIRM|nr:trehalose-phosphatase [Moorella mulderi]KYH33007.1 trehalose-6-phosphate phosphatase [Moorella mulderi DSM 14980]
MSPAQLAAKVRDYPQVLLMCDYDGTLVPLAPRPELARPGPRLLTLLRQLVSRPGLHLAIISGRSLRDLLELLPVGGLYYAGLHGLEVATPEGRITSLLPPGQEDIPWDEIFRLACRVVAGIAGLFVENKGEAIALHYRLADPQLAAAALEQFRQGLKPFLNDNLELLPGHKVLEVRRRGINKGLAVTYFTRQWPRALPVYLGDDRTDEDAFSALPAGGLAIRIGKQVASRARYFLPSPAAVVQFLELLTSF